VQYAITVLAITPVGTLFPLILLLVKARRDFPPR
jgi:hypothetical protein